MKFGRSVAQVNTRQRTESDFWCDVEGLLSRAGHAWRQEKA